MDHVLHAVNDDRTVRSFGQSDDSLHAQKLRSLGRTQHIEEYVEGNFADCGEARKVRKHLYQEFSKLCYVIFFKFREGTTSVRNSLKNTPSEIEYFRFPEDVF